jgi:hypothetical protein
VVNAATYVSKRDAGSVADMVVTAKGVRDLAWLTLTPNRLPIMGCYRQRQRSRAKP